MTLQEEVAKLQKEIDDMRKELAVAKYRKTHKPKKAPVIFDTKNKNYVVRPNMPGETFQKIVPKTVDRQILDLVEEYKLGQMQDESFIYKLKILL